jgi:hypothetical protein
VSRKRSGAWSKWRRAKRHLETLRDELGVAPGRPYGWSKRYRATQEAHRNGLEYRFYVDAEKIDSKDWPLLVGDCLFNLRSALDHLVFDLHVKAFGGKVPDAIAERSQFPILTTPPPWRSRSSDPAKWPEIGNLAYKQRRAITWLQPYNGRNDQYRNLRRDLGRIASFNNIDKHRHLHVLQASPHMAEVAWFGDDPAWGWQQQSFLGVPLVGKTEVFRWTFDTAPPRAEIANYLQGDGHVTAFICLNEGGESLILLLLLRNLMRTVATVLTRFAIFLR